jgi:L-asparaginase / beta-aspartyl-peptidase
MKAATNSRRVALSIRRSVILLLLMEGAAVYLVGCSRPSTGDDQSMRDAIESVLHIQQDAWNRGDIDAFVDHYWKSDALTFSAGGKTNRGFTATLNRYREKYPTREEMGRLSFSELEITPLGDSAALVLGQWSLQRETDPVGGNFSLVLRKLDNRWLIIHDHTSRKTE